MLLIAIAAGWAQSGFWGALNKEDAQTEASTPQTPIQWIEPFQFGLPADMGELPTGLANVTAQGCNACHFQAHNDWVGSAHAGTGQDPVFRAAIERSANSTACKQCHLPLAVQHPSLATGYIEGDLSRPKLVANAAWDPTLMAEGVGCAACHVRSGHIISTREIRGGPHPVAASRTLGTSEMCATCHQMSFPESDRPYYDTYGEWKASPYADAGMRCQDCHMPPTAGIASATRFAATPSHGFQSDISRALSVLVDLESAEIQRGTATTARIRIQNTGAGHHVPTGSPYKSYVIQVSLTDINGVDLTPPHVERLERKVSTEAPYNTLFDNRIAAGGEHEVQTEFLVSHSKKAGPVRLTVRIGRDGNAPVLQSIPLELL